MRFFVLSIISFIAIVPQIVQAAEKFPPQGPTAVPQPAVPQPALSKEQLTHLKAAAEHLAKAGRKAEAAKLLEQAAAAESAPAAALLAKKEKELDRLQAEVEQLRKMVQRQTMISLSFQVIEVSPAKLKSGSPPDFKLFFPKSDGQTKGFAVLEDPSEVGAAIDTLRKKGLIKVLAAPTLATISGRKVLFSVGAEEMIHGVENGRPRAKNLFVGTLIEARPVLTEDGKLRLALELRVTDQNDRRDGEAIPAVNAHELQTEVELAFDRVFMLRGVTREHSEPQPNPNANKGDVDTAMETIVLITPKRLAGTEPVVNPAVRASYAPAAKGAVFPAPLNFGGVTPRVIHQEEEEERLIKQ
ncbi:MAG: hypothetical protein WD894_05170 [Pirellulales bacterium]